MKKTLILAALSISGILLGGSIQTAYSVTIESIKVEPSQIQTRTFDLSKGTEIKGSFSVAGAINDINFWVTDPSGNTIVPKTSVQSFTSFDFTASSDGTYTLNFDNSMSTESEKLITLSYDIIKPVGDWLWHSFLK